MRQLRTSKFADFILFYKGTDGIVNKREFNDTELANVYRIARSFPQGIIWRIRQLPGRAV